MEPKNDKQSKRLGRLQRLEYRIHGVKVHALQPDLVSEQINEWLRDDKGQNGEKFRYIVSTNINNIVCALESPHYFTVMEEADMSVPDGVPLLWIGRYFGYHLPKRCGIEEVMERLFILSNVDDKYTHFFYGNTEAVLEKLKAKLNLKYPKLRIVGMLSPPFRDLTKDEEENHLKIINDIAPDFIWVSLGCPKQEIWLQKNRPGINRGIGAGVGAVVNFFSEEISKAPNWIRMAGLEWLFRLCTEPSRLWRRYLIRYPKFFLHFMLQK